MLAWTPWAKQYAKYMYIIITDGHFVYYSLNLNYFISSFIQVACMYVAKQWSRPCDTHATDLLVLTFVLYF